VAEFSALFGFALGVTGRTFLWVILGALLYRTMRLPDQVVQQISLFAFRFGLPAVLFFGAVRVDYRQAAHARYLLAALIATLVVVAAALAYARLRNIRGENAAIFVQGAYRANTGVVGIALAAAAYGEEGVALAALPVALLTILYNLIAVVLLGSVYSAERSPVRWLGDILRNPLVIGIALGAACSLSGLSLNFHLERVGTIFSALMLPLALGCIGASLNLRVLRESGLLTLEASVWKLLVTPLAVVGLAAWMGVHSAELGVLFLLTAAPVASASYIMVSAAGGNGALAANIVVASTLLSLPSITVGLAVLQVLGWV
jgi:predicted permease